MALPISITTHINELPAEMIDHIMSYLPLADRKSTSLACKRWEEQAFTHHYLAKIRLILKDNSDKHLDVKLLQKSWRTYRYVTVEFGKTEFDVTLIMLVLEKFGKRIEVFSSITVFRPRQLQEVLNRLPNCRRLMVGVINDGDPAASALEFPVLKHLVYLKTTEAIFEMPGMDTYRMMPSLRNLSLCCQQDDTENTVKALNSISARLKMLVVYCKLRWAPHELLNLRQLETLKLLGTNSLTTSESLRQLFVNVPMLKVLFLSGRMSTSLFEVICNNCPQLTSFGFTVNEMEHTSLSVLSKLTNLKILRIEGCLTYHMFDGCEPLLKVQTFYLYCRKKRLGTERFANQLHYMLPNVKIFQLVGTKNIEMDYQFLYYVGKMFTKIKELTVSDFMCPSADLRLEDSFKWIGELVNVEQFTLRRMPLENIGCQRGSKNVKKVRLEFLDQLVGTGLLQVSDIYPNLKCLEIVRCALITAQDVELFQEVMPHCVVNFVER